MQYYIHIYIYIYEINKWKLDINLIWLYIDIFHYFPLFCFSFIFLFVSFLRFFPVSLSTVLECLRIYIYEFYTLSPSQWDFIRAEASRGSCESWASGYTVLAFIGCSQKERQTFGPIQQKDNNHSVASELSTQTHTQALFENIISLGRSLGDT